MTVKSGETLSDIAARCGVSVNSLMRVNGLRDSDFVQAGQRLRIPEPSVLARAATPCDPATP